MELGSSRDVILQGGGAWIEPGSEGPSAGGPPLCRTGAVAGLFKHAIRFVQYRFGAEPYRGGLSCAVRTSGMKREETMERKLQDAYAAEIGLARLAASAGNVESAFRHLERAHIIGQRHTGSHVRSHWLMLRLAASVGQWREVAGQGVRVVAAALFSRIWVPAGNTGRANVSAMQPMPIPQDLRDLLEAAPWR